MKLIKEINKKESGQAFIIVLILLVLGGLMIGPLLAYMNTGLLAGQAYEERMDELYAADAGVEDALWQIITKAAGLPQAEDDPPMPPYSIDPVNGKEFVDDPIIITYIDERTYKIESTATSVDTGSSTKIESYLNILNFTLFAENAITSPVSVTLPNNIKQSDVTGDIHTPSLSPPGYQPTDGIWDSSPVEGWPDDAADIQLLRNFYLSQISSNSTSTYIEGDYIINSPSDWPTGPLYVNGNLEIRKSGTVHGTIYVTRNIEFRGATVDFNGSTIYAQAQDHSSNLKDYCITTQPTTDFQGIGCLIGEWSINFQPKQTAGGFIFVMSIKGMTWFKPGGDFIGSIAGKTKVDMQPGCTLTNPYTPEEIRDLNLNYPGGLTANNVISKILTWEISLQ